VYLALQQHAQVDLVLFPLLVTGTAVTYMLLAAPLGRLADRIGRHTVLLGGYGVLLAAYVALVVQVPGTFGVLLVLALLGTYYAAIDGVLMALASAHVPDETRGTGLAVLGTASSLARLTASLLFGALWTAFGITTAFVCFAVALTAVIAATTWVLGRGPGRA
jgi:MFS family permease